MNTGLQRETYRKRVTAGLQREVKQVRDEYRLIVKGQTGQG